MINRQNAQRGATAVAVLGSLAFVIIMIVAVYGLILMRSLTGELKSLSGKMASLNKLDTLATDIHSLSQRLAVLEETNKRIAHMEKYMSYVPRLAYTGDQALLLSQGTNQRLEVTNQRLLATDKCLTGSVNKMSEVADGLRVMPVELRQVRGSIDKMAGQFPALGEMRDLLVKTNATLDKTSDGITKVSTGFDEMGSMLKNMSTQFDALPQMKTSFDGTSSTITNALLAFEPMNKEFSKLTASIYEMNNTTKEMAITTKDMAKNMNKTPRQGAIGLGILTAAQLLGH